MLPEGMTYERLHDRLKLAGFVVYAGQGQLSKTAFRVANMGHVAEDDFRRFVQAVSAAVV
jgi:2-aminoethylphosphonate-pyruvate transaminase